jgi:hypothetical protein
MPLVNSGGLANNRQAEQQELPAWLESLRANERPVAGGLGDQQPFSMADLVDENSMPRWMRQDQAGQAESGSSDAFPALSANMQAGSKPEQQAFPGKDLQAGSLIDEQSLPEWMRGSQEGGQPGTGQNISANSLVDTRALPPWIKELGQTTPQAQPAPRQYGSPQPTQAPLQQQYGLPPQPQRPAEMQYGLPLATPMTPTSLNNLTSMPQTPPVPVRPESPATFAHGFSAHDLVDPGSLPGWMTGAQDPGQQSQSRPVPTEKGFSANELIDARSLPNWMKDQKGQEKSDPISAMGVPVSGSGQMSGMEQGISRGEGMPASTLLDMGAMPTWMREGEPGGGAQGIPPASGMAAGSLVDMGAMPTWMREGGSSNTPGTPPASGMVAGSLIDMGAMPAWMRNESAPPPDPGTPAPAAQPRNEGMRVPSRPRSEVPAPGQSEAAATIFSSMLGVSASAPVMPGQGPTMGQNSFIGQNPASMGQNSAMGSTLGVAQGQAAPFYQPPSPAPVLPGWQSPQTAVQGSQSQPWQSSGTMQGPGSSPVPNSSTSWGQVGAMGAMPYANRTDQPVYTGLSADRIGAGGNNQGGTSATETKKKGFFDSIRDFFVK